MVKLNVYEHQKNWVKAKIDKLQENRCKHDGERQNSKPYNKQMQQTGIKEVQVQT